MSDDQFIQLHTQMSGMDRKFSDQMTAFSSELIQMKLSGQP